MFRKSLVLVSMVFGLNAWGAPPQSITSGQLIKMLQDNTGIKSDDETWKLEKTDDLLGEPVDEKKVLRPFLNKLPATHRTALSRIRDSKAEYTIQGTDGIFYTVILQKQ